MSEGNTFRRLVLEDWNSDKLIARVDSDADYPLSLEMPTAANGDVVAIVELDISNIRALAAFLKEHFPDEQ